MPPAPSPPARATGPVVLGWVLGLSFAVAPEAPARPLPVAFHSEYQVEAWTPEDGFPENSCSGILPGPDGYLWMTTFRGLVRFNGHEFRRWAPPQLPMLGAVSIVNTHRDPQGRIWFSTWEGLVLHERGTWRHWRTESGWGTTSDYVRSYASHPRAGIVFGRFSGDATRYADGHFEALPPIPGRGGAFCAFDETGRLYAARAGSIVTLEGGRWRPLDLDNATVSLVLGVSQDRAGQARLICRDELLTLREGQVSARLKLSQPIRGFWQITSAPDGTLWIASLDSGVYRVSPDGTVKNLRKADGLPNAGGARAIHLGERGTVWVGSGVGGLTSFRPARFHQLSDIDSVSDREILSLAPLPDGSILFAPTGVPLQLVEDHSTARPAAPRGPAAFPRTLLRASDGTVWCGTLDRGLMRWERDALVPAGDEIFVGGEPVVTLFEDSRQRLWIGGTTRVAFRADGDFQPVAVPEAGERTPTFFAERADGSILLARENLVYRYAGGAVDPRPLVRLPAKTRISTLLVDRDDRLWIGTQFQGLFVHHENSLREVNDRRIQGQQVSALHLDTAGALWFGCGRRIGRIEPAALWTIAVDPNARPNLQFFDAEDGLRSLDFPYGTQPTVAPDHLGRLWFALIRGATMIDPARLVIDSTPPQVVVESIDYVQHQEDRVQVIDTLDRSSPPTLPAGSRMIRISYAALDFTAPRKQRYRVRLNAERDWQDMQGATTVSFFELPPGLHTLQVQAAGSDGAWNQQGALLAFQLAPFYWQTAWFRLLTLGGLVTLAGAGAWLLSQRRLRQVHEALVRERHLAAAQARLALV
ncbi:MAG TPA: two-component regulator propeller domain-containing protein, partial [Opitutaceae bacterium]